MKRKATSIVLGLLAWAGLASAANAAMQDFPPTGGTTIQLRTCQGGSHAGARCKQASDCSGGTCPAYNIINFAANFYQMDVSGQAIPWNPSQAEIDAVKEGFRSANNALFEAYEGQFVIGKVDLIYGNKAPNATIQIHPDTDPNLPYEGSSDVGELCRGGVMLVTPNCLSAGNCFVHEFTHLAGNALEEYQGPELDGVDNDSDGEIDECSERETIYRCYGGANNGRKCNRDGDLSDCLGLPCWAHTCFENCVRGVCNNPVEWPGCVMQGGSLVSTRTELCVEENHDPEKVTEQSKCRNDHSCWTTVLEQWSDVLLGPVGLPQTQGPAPNSSSIVFSEPNMTGQIVLALDRSASMGEDTPPRFYWTVNSIRWIIDWSSNGVQLGIISYSSVDADSHPSECAATQDFPSDACALPADPADLCCRVPGLREMSTDIDRAAAKNALSGIFNDMNPDPLPSSRLGGCTDIGAGLRKAKEAIQATGTSFNASVILYTDGLNNRPEPYPDDSLLAAVEELRAAGIRLLVTCVGESRATNQCARLADLAGGRFVDAIWVEDLQNAFVDFVGSAEGAGVVGTGINRRLLPGQTQSEVLNVEEGATSLQINISWQSINPVLSIEVERPDETLVDPSLIKVGMQGGLLRVEVPQAGQWTIRTTAISVPATGVLWSGRALINHPSISVQTNLDRASPTWPQAFVLRSIVRDGFPIVGCDVRGRARISSHLLC